VASIGKDYTGMDGQQNVKKKKEIFPLSKEHAQENGGEVQWVGCCVA